jgi:hypothetical protein
MSTTRRIFFYAVALVTLGIFAGGLGQLLLLVFDLTLFRYESAIGQVGFISQQLSLGLAMVVIGGPFWLLFWRAIQHSVEGNEVEIGSATRKLFLNFVLTVASITALSSLLSFLQLLLSGPGNSMLVAPLLSTFVVTGVVWQYHWKVAEAERQPSAAARTLRRWYVYILSGFGLILLSFGVVNLINVSIRSLPVWSDTLVSGPFWNDSIRNSISMIVIGGIAWMFHWFRMAKDDTDSGLREVYLYLITILGSAVAGLVALTDMIYSLLNLAFGGVTGAMGGYFQFISWAVPTFLVALAIWTYHQKTTEEESTQAEQLHFSAERVHLYLMSLVGLGTLIGGVIALFGVLLNVIINVAGTTIVLAPGWWQSQLSLALALLVVGVPLWLNYWKKVLRRVETGTVVEWAARSRRIYLYLTVIAATIALAVSLVWIVYQLLIGILRGPASDILANVRWSLQILFIAAAVLYYHFQVVRQDQRSGAEKAAVHKSVSILAGESARGLVARIEKRLSFRPNILSYLGPLEEPPSVSDEDIDKLMLDIQSAPGTKVMLVISDGKISVLPFAEK